jgi:hypothetical protein
MKRKSFLSSIGKGVMLSALLPHLAFSNNAQQPFFLLITGGGVSLQDLKEKVFPSALGQCTNLFTSVHDMLVSNHELSHTAGFEALCGLDLKNLSYSSGQETAIFYTSNQSGRLDKKHSFLKDEESFEAALNYKINHPQSSIICYLNEADAGHYSIEKYNLAITRYAEFSKKLILALSNKNLLMNGNIAIASEIGRDLLPTEKNSGWHHVCPESRKTTCLWISRFPATPTITNPVQIVPLLKGRHS